MGDYDFLHEPPYTFGECYEEDVEAHVYYNGLYEDNIFVTLRREGNIVSMLLHEKYWALPIGSRTGDCFLNVNLQKYIYNIDSKFDIHRTRDKYFNGFMKVYDDTRPGNKLKVVPALMELDNGLLTITAIDEHKKGAQVYPSTKVSLFGIYPSFIQVSIDPSENYEIQPDLDLDGPNGDADSDEEMEVNNWETRTIVAFTKCDAADMDSLTMSDSTFTITLKRNLVLNKGIIIIPKMLLPIKQQEKEEEGSGLAIYFSQDKVEEFFGRLPPFSDGKVSYIPTQYYSRKQKKIVTGIGCITFKSSKVIWIYPNSDNINEYFFAKDRSVDDDDEIGLPEKNSFSFVLDEEREEDDIDLGTDLDEGVPEDVETSSSYESLNFECTVRCEAWDGIDQKAIFTVYKTKAAPLQAYLKIPAVTDDIRLSDDTGTRNMLIQNCIAKVNDFLGDNYYVNTGSLLGSIKIKKYDSDSYLSEYEQVTILSNGIIQVGNNTFKIAADGSDVDDIGIVKGKIFKLNFEQHDENYIHKDENVPADINDTSKYEKHNISCTATCEVWRNGPQELTLTLYTEKNNSTPTKAWLKIPSVMDEVDVNSRDSERYPLEINAGSHDFGEYLPDGYMVTELDRFYEIHAHAIQRARNEPYDGNFDVSVFVNRISIDREVIGFYYAMEGYPISEADKMIGTSCTAILTLGVTPCPTPTRGDNVPENYNSTSLYTVGEDIYTAECESWTDGFRDILIKHYVAKNLEGATHCYIEIPMMAKYIFRSDTDDYDHPIIIRLDKGDMDDWLGEDYEFVYEDEVGTIKGIGYNRETDTYGEISMQVALVEEEGIVIGEDNTGLYKAKSNSSLIKYVGVSEYAVLAFPIRKKNGATEVPENPTKEELENEELFSKSDFKFSITCEAWEPKSRNVVGTGYIYQSLASPTMGWIEIESYKGEILKVTSDDAMKDGPIIITITEISLEEYNLPTVTVETTTKTSYYGGDDSEFECDNAKVQLSDGGTIKIYADDEYGNFYSVNTTNDSLYLQENPTTIEIGFKEDIIIPITLIAKDLPSTGGEQNTFKCNVDCDTFEHNNSYYINLDVAKNTETKKMTVTFPEIMVKIHVYTDPTETFADVIQINAQDVAEFAGDLYIPSGKLKEDVPVTCYNGKEYIETTGFVYFDGFSFVIVPNEGLIQHFYATYDRVNADYIGVHKEFELEIDLVEEEPMYVIFDEDEHYKFETETGRGYITAQVMSILSTNMSFTTQIFVETKDNGNVELTIFPFSYPILYKAAMGSIVIDTSDIKTVIGTKLINGQDNSAVSVTYMNSKSNNSTAEIVYESSRGCLILQATGGDMFTINGDEGHITLKEITTITFKDKTQTDDAA